MKAFEATLQPQTDRVADAMPVLPDDASVTELMRSFAPLLADEAVTELINRPQRILTETHRGGRHMIYRNSISND